MKKRARKHANARLAVLAASLILLSYSVLVYAPSRIASMAGDMFASASIGLYASVPPNPDNTLAAELEQRAEELEKREANLTAAPANSLSDTLGLYSFFISLILLGLVAANFYLDVRRGTRPLAKSNLSIDLR